jgi:hypothetical protein
MHASRDPSVPPLRLELEAEAATKSELVPAFLDAVEARDSTRTQHELDVISACAAADRALAEGGSVDVEYA